jgi:2'-5' RNA ligase
MRTFIAVDLPESLKETIEDVESGFELQGVKLVEPELLHVTIKFLGEVDASAVSSICKALSQIRCKPFEATIEGIGTFPKPDYIKIIWLGVTGNFEVLHQKVEDALASFGFKPDNNFVAHITLARIKKIDRRRRDRLKESLSSVANIRIGSFTVDMLKLKKSTLTPQGPLYETLCEIPLKQE